MSPQVLGDFGNLHCGRRRRGHLRGECAAVDAPLSLGSPVAEIIELVPGLTAIRKEMASLPELHATLHGAEAAKHAVIIAALDVALADLLKGRR